MSKEDLRKLLTPVVRLLMITDVSPNFMTLIGFFMHVLPAWLIVQKHFVIAGITLILASIVDALDGELARRTNRVSKFGAFLDSTLDRFSEFLIFLAFAYAFKENEPIWIGFIVGMFGSFMVSYTRARSEGLGYSTKVGPMDRTMRIVFLSAMCFFHEYLSFLLAIFCILVYTTVFRRMYDVLKHT